MEVYRKAGEMTSYRMPLSSKQKARQIGEFAGLYLFIHIFEQKGMGNLHDQTKGYKLDVIHFI